MDDVDVQAGLLRKCRDRWAGLFAGESRQQIAISISALTGSGLIAIAIRFLGTLVQGRFVGPEVLGYYAAFTILPTYLYLLHLGVFTALSRQYPYWIGQGNRDRALSYAANGLGWARALGALQAVGFSVPCLWAVGRGDWMAAAGWGTQSVLSMTDRYMMYLASTYRSSSEFVVWSKTSVISALASIVVLPVVIVHGFVGVCLRAAVPNVVALWYAHIRRPLKIKARVHRPVLLDMIAFGAPLMVVGYVGTFLWDAVTSSFILARLDSRQLGVMSFALTLCMALVTVASSISNVFLPRIAALYGSSGNNMEVSIRYCLRASLLGCAVVTPLILLAWLVLDPFVRLFLPAYVDSVPVARWLCWLALLPVLELPRQLLVVAKRTRAYSISVLMGFGIFCTVLLGAPAYGQPLTLQAIVVASVLCKFLAVLLGNAFAWYGARPVGNA